MIKSRTYDDIFERSHWNDKKSIAVLEHRLITEHHCRRLKRLIRHTELLRLAKMNVALENAN